ncbi:MAG: hypothetical protein RIF39_04200 [Cyclobacteriaceae bacterium]
MISKIESLLLNGGTAHKNEKIAIILSKSFYLFLILKIAFLWPVINNIIANNSLQLGPGIRYVIFAPLALVKINLLLFIIPFIGILILGITIKPNYFFAVAIFWFSISLSKLITEIANGSDLILNIFLFISIFLSITPKITLRNGSQLQQLIFNSALLLGQVQMALIYLLSGYDKLLSAAWRNGEAMHSIFNLTFFQNPFIKLNFSETECVILCWMVIIFEISFAVLIWIKKFRITLLVMGVFFHLGIIVFLGLADFGMVMIICYTVFLPVKNSSARDLTVAVVN